MSKPTASSPRLRSKPATAEVAAPVEIKPAKPARAPAKTPPVKAPKVSAEAVAVEAVIAAPPVEVVEPAPAEPAPQVAPEVPVEAAPVEAEIPVPVAEAIAPTASEPAVPPAEPTPQPTAKEIPMSETIDLSTAKNAFHDLQAKAKAGLEKSQALLAEANEFAKGNLEAVVESSKLAAATVQELTGTFIAESKAAFETFSAEAKELASTKSPVDFFKLHSELTLKHFDNAVAYSSKQSEKLMKLTSEVTAPLTARVSLAMEKLQKAA